MTRQERKAAAEKYAAKFVNDEVRREVKKAFFAGCDCESAEEIIHGEVLETEFNYEQKVDGEIITSFPDGYLDLEIYDGLNVNLFRDGDKVEILIRKKQ